VPPAPDIREGRSWWPPSFELSLVLLVFLPSLLYALVFGRMVALSIFEELILPDPLRPRFMGPVHHHNWVEWVLILGPAVIGWLGTLGSLVYLARRWRTSRPET
jgi:hypothetical protein